MSTINRSLIISDKENECISNKCIQILNKYNDPNTKKLNYQVQLCQNNGETLYMLQISNKGVKACNNFMQIRKTSHSVFKSKELNDKSDFFLTRSYLFFSRHSHAA